MKKILVGLAVLISVCLTAAMIADLFFHPDRPEKKQTVQKPVSPSPIKPVEEGISEPKDIRQAEGLKEKPAPDKPAPDKSAPDKLAEDKPIKYEVFEGVDQTVVEKPPPKVKPLVPRIAIIIDDIGYDKKIALELSELDSNLTFSVLPFSPHGRNISEDLHSKGSEIMLHLPMEPVDHPHVDPGPGAILSAMPPDDLLEQLKKTSGMCPISSGSTIIWDRN
nr:divergent polysaccharide deacetylase family protein [Desulfobacula sp.]